MIAHYLTELAKHAGKVINDMSRKNEKEAEEKRIHKENTKPVLYSSEIEEILKAGK